MLRYIRVISGVFFLFKRLIKSIIASLLNVRTSWLLNHALLKFHLRFYRDYIWGRCYSREFFLFFSCLLKNALDWMVPPFITLIMIVGLLDPWIIQTCSRCNFLHSLASFGVINEAWRERLTDLIITWVVLYWWSSAPILFLISRSFRVHWWEHV